jgi:hypothetical protein
MTNGINIIKKGVKMKKMLAVAFLFCTFSIINIHAITYTFKNKTETPIQVHVSGQNCDKSVYIEKDKSGSITCGSITIITLQGMEEPDKPLTGNAKRYNDIGCFNCNVDENADITWDGAFLHLNRVKTD